MTSEPELITPPGVTTSAHLRRNTLTGGEVTATSLASIGPAIGSIFLISSIASGVGPAIGFAILIGGIGFLLHINSMAEFNRKMPSAGGYTHYAAKVFGGRVGAMTGMMYLIAGLGIAIALVLQLGIFVSAAVQGIFSYNLSWWIPAVVFSLIITALLVRGIKISIRVVVTLFLFEVLSILISAIVMLIVNRHYISTAAFNPGEVHNGVVGIGAAFVLSIFMFTGASSPAPLAEETIRPKKTVPAALLIATSSAIVIYLFVSWALVTAFHNNASPILSTPLPFLVGAERALKPLGDLLYIAGSTSAIAVLIGDANSYSRAFYHLSRENLLPKSFGRIHATWHTPWIAILSLMGFSLIVALLVAGLVGAGNAFNYLATLGTIAFVMLYLLMNVAVPVYFRREHRSEFSTSRHLVIPVLGIVALAYPLWETAKPSQPYPYNWFGVIGLAFVVLSVVFGLLKVSTASSKLMGSYGVEEEVVPVKNEG